MIYTLRVECVFGMYLEDDCTRIIEFMEDASLFDLHDAIQDAVNFGRDHPFTFYIANSWRGIKREWLSTKDGWEDQLDDFFEIKLKDIWPLGRRRLYYWFDFGDRWTFEIRKERKIKKPEPGVNYPRVVQSMGLDPVQYP